MRDLTTGLELELLLPEGTGRIDLLHELADWADARVEIFPFVSKVPVPTLDGEGLEPEALVEATVALIHRTAEHHQALLHSVTEDGAHFYLIHRAGRLLDDEGRVLLTVVHDNTIAGGERVAEVVTPPFQSERLPWIDGLVARLAAVPGITVPEGGALHVHVDGRPFQDTAALARLVLLYDQQEAELRRDLGTPDTFRAAAPLPPGLAPELLLHLAEGAPWEVTRATLGAHVRDRSHGLNLYNLLGFDPEKLTVELKLARSTLDPAEVRRARAALLALAEGALVG